MGTKRISAVFGIGCVVLLGLAFTYDWRHKGELPQGVAVAGVDVGGLRLAVARTRLNQNLRAPLERPLILNVGDTKYTVPVADLGVKVSSDDAVEEAHRRARSGLFVVRAVRWAVGRDAAITVPAPIEFSEAAVKTTAGRIERENERAPVEARVSFSGSGVGEVNGKSGIAINARRLRTDIVATLTTPAASRSIRVKLRRVRPKLTRKDLAGRYPVALTVDRAGFKLRLFKRLKLARTFRIAVGKVGMETPAGLYTINNKAINPTWHVPNRKWAGKLAGKSIPGGAPNNPIKARWLGIYGGVGIHGTDAANSIGTAASHGCVRMLIPEVMQLYEEVPIGTPVFIG